MRKLQKSFLFLAFFFLLACNKAPKSTENFTTTYTQLFANQTGVDFYNTIDVSILLSPIQYINVFNGGGVAVGDINKDGKADVFFTGNVNDNQLYLNKGDFQFENITAKAGVASSNSWCTGAAMVDINNDGYLDIYVCRAYREESDFRKNQLFINNGDLTFTERAAEYGLDDAGYSIQATFFDYDQDGKLDVFVGNHPKERYQSSQTHYNNWLNPTMEFSDQLYHNDGNGRFTNVTQQAGVLNYGWTLGVVAADLNQDGWTDLYVTVDHEEPDRLYINNQDGTFSENSRKALRHISLSAMGVDASDFNNDGLLDVVTAEMLAVDHFREKTQMMSMSVANFWKNVIGGYNYQYMRNMLHVNNGNGTFREIGQMANIHKTDWSWAALFFDMDNDGWKDLYISNGYYKDYSDQDYRNAFNAALVALDKEGNMNEKLRLLGSHADTVASTKLPNYLFKNNGDLTFTDYSKASGLDQLGFSSGAAYVDLDNDGDLDMVVNNINEKALIYRNNTTDLKPENHWLQINLIPLANQTSMGTKVWLKTGDDMQFQELTMVRGYQSSVEAKLHFGLGTHSVVEEIKVRWPDGNEQLLTNVKTNQLLNIIYKKGEPQVEPVKNKPFKEVTAESGVNFIHEEVYCDDYAKQVLLPHQMSCFGPALVVADINNDGLDDFYIGGAQDHEGSLYLQHSSGKFMTMPQQFALQDKRQEDLNAAFFDADGDGDKDLYIVSGGNEFDHQDDYYQDRFYLNDGRGNFTKSNNRIPKMTESGSCVKPFDFDYDGDLDLFVGTRHIPGKYPFPASSFLLENQNGYFKDVTQSKAPDLASIGMVTDAKWTDLNQDGQMDLFLVGEWMPLTFLIQKEGVFKNETSNFNLSSTRGWWNRIAEGDFDEDGDLDFIIGNLGLNYKYKSDENHPFHVYANDFDDNGANDIVLGYMDHNELFPVRGRQCSSQQMPEIAEKFPTYASFAKASLKEVYGEELEEALHYTIDNFESSILINNGDGSYTLKPLPVAAQSSPINAIIVKDFDGDQHLDLLMAGNLFVSEVETGRADSGIGFFLKGDGKGGFKNYYFVDSGFYTPNDVKQLEFVTMSTGKHYILVGNNHNPMQVIEWEKMQEIE